MHHPAIPITLRLLAGTSDDLCALQIVIEGAPRYALLLTGAQADPAEAASLFAALPPGRTCADKFVFGFFSGDVMVGCADLIRGYPDASTAFVGLLLFAEACEGRGWGRWGFAALEDVVRQWPGCTTLRLGVLRTNVRAARFWASVGFLPTGEVRPYRHDPVETEIVVHAKMLWPTHTVDSATNPESPCPSSH